MKSIRSQVGETVIIMSLMVSLFSAARASADAGSKEGNGGDPTAVSVAHVHDFIQDALKLRAYDFVKSLDVGRIQNAEAQAALRDMTKRGLLTDILNSPYQLKPVCQDSAGIPHSASSIKNELSGPICFNVEKLARESASDWQILALLMHEEAHHFGYEDKADLINSAVLALVTPEPPSHSYVTHSGATFEWVTNHPEMGDHVFKDPSGLIWGAPSYTRWMDGALYLSAPTYSEAVTYCVSQGARLPTKEEFTQLAKYLGAGTSEGYQAQVLENLAFYQQGQGDFWGPTGGLWYIGGVDPIQVSDGTGAWQKCAVPELAHTSYCVAWTRCAGTRVSEAFDGAHGTFDWACVEGNGASVRCVRGQ